MFHRAEREFSAYTGASDCVAVNSGTSALHLGLVQRVADDDGVARARHVQALKRAQDHLDAAQSHLDPAALALDLLAEELRLAHGALGEITGAFTADDLLGEIFGKFCIGK